MREELALHMEGITKRFPGVLALDHVKLSVKKGEVHALLGENGAGKSTLMKILSGAYVKDEGSITVMGQKVELGDPRISEALGIGTIYQELNLIGSLTVAENIFMGRHITNKFGKVDWTEIYRKSDEILQELEVDISSHDLIKDLGIAHQQMVEVAKALSMNAKIIIMDEPSAPLTEKETTKLFSTIAKLKKSGISIIYISHRLEEVKFMCDSATVMRDGTYVTKVDVCDVTIDDIIKLMVGRELNDKYPRIEKTIGKEVLSVENLCAGSRVQNVSFNVKAGEVLCIGGLVGAGRTESMRAIFGLDHKTAGVIKINGKEVDIKTPRDAIEAGIGFVTEDRKEEGLVLPLSVGENITVSSLDKFTKAGRLNLKKESEMIQKYVDLLKIKTPSALQKVGNLSGGNQQKVVLAKWLLSDCQVLILDEPTRGIDVGAKIEVYNLINDLAKEGKAIIAITSEIPELLGICDRVAIMARGKIRGELGRDEANQENIMTMAVAAEDI